MILLYGTSAPWASCASASRAIACVLRTIASAVVPHASGRPPFFATMPLSPARERAWQRGA